VAASALGSTLRFIVEAGVVPGRATHQPRRLQCNIGVANGIAQGVVTGLVRPPRRRVVLHLRLSRRFIGRVRPSSVGIYVSGSCHLI